MLFPRPRTYKKKLSRLSSLFWLDLLTRSNKRCHCKSSLTSLTNTESRKLQNLSETTKKSVMSTWRPLSRLLSRKRQCATEIWRSITSIGNARYSTQSFQWQFVLLQLTRLSGSIVISLWSTKPALTIPQRWRATPLQKTCKRSLRSLQQTSLMSLRTLADGTMVIASFIQKAKTQTLLKSQLGILSMMTWFKTQCFQPWQLRSLPWRMKLKESDKCTKTNTLERKKGKWMTKIIIKSSSSKLSVTLLSKSSNQESWSWSKQRKWSRRSRAKSVTLWSKLTTRKSKQVYETLAWTFLRNSENFWPT